MGESEGEYSNADKDDIKTALDSKRKCLKCLFWSMWLLIFLMIILTIVILVGTFTVTNA
jgi:hypothetical protein